MNLKRAHTATNKKNLLGAGTTVIRIAYDEDLPRLEPLLERLVQAILLITDGLNLFLERSGMARAKGGRMKKGLYVLDTPSYIVS